MPGPPPMPNERARRLGNPSKKSLPNPHEVLPLPHMPTDTPDQLGAAGKAVWELVTRAGQWLADTDRPALVLLCEKTDRRALIQDELTKSSLVLYTDKMYAYPNPLVGMLSTVETEIAKLYSVLGLTPVDRTRMGVAEVKAQSAFESMLARKQDRE